MSSSPLEIITKVSTSIENIKCFLRCKPLNKNEQELSAQCIEISNDKTTISVDMSAANKDEKLFSLDQIFSEQATQEEIFEELCKPLLNSFIQGYNCTIFAYGQTGAGKTHTMFGPIEDLYEEYNTNHGLIPRILSFIFNNKNIINLLSSNSNDTIREGQVVYGIKCSCLEIYQDHLMDLLKKSNEEDEHLIIREDQNKGMYIENLTKVNILNEKHAKELLMTGMKNRHIASTNMNAASSRSHLIYTLFLESTVENGNEVTMTKTSRMHLIDLAGSERQKATQAMGERIKEAGNINKSLSILGNVINALIEQGNNPFKNKFVPFRDSKLTHFLKDSLGGNSKTIIIANISQSVIQLQETISTLKFVQRAKMITNKTAVNENISEKRKIALLENEIKRLQEIIRTNGSTTIIENHNKNVNDDDTQLLLKKINEFITYEDIISKKMKLLDVIGLNSIEQFFNTKEKYEKDIQDFININSMNEKINVIKQELEIYKCLGQYYQNRKHIEGLQSQFSNDFIMKFISLHRDLKAYLTESFGTFSELMVTDKLKFAKKEFQLKELSIANEEHVRTIEELQNENFLLSMELVKFRNDDDFLYNNSEEVFITEKNNHQTDISEFSLTPTKSGNNNSTSLNKQTNDNNNSNSKLFLSNLKKSYMKSEQSFKSNNSNEILILKENLDNALKAMKENEQTATTLSQLNNSIQSENSRLRNELSNIKDEFNTLNSVIHSYKKQIKNLNNQLDSLRKIIFDHIGDISINVAENNCLISQLSLLSEDIVLHMKECLSNKLYLDEKEIIIHEKSIIDLKRQKKQLIEEIKLINNEYDQTLSSQEKFNAKIRIYNRIKDKGDHKKEYEDLVSLIYSILPQCNNENNNDSNKSFNSKTAIERVKHAAETIDLFNFYKETQVNKLKQKKQREVSQNTICHSTRSKSPLPKRK